MKFVINKRDLSLMLKLAMSKSKGSGTMLPDCKLIVQNDQLITEGLAQTGSYYLKTFRTCQVDSPGEIKIADVEQFLDIISAFRHEVVLESTDEGTILIKERNTSYTYREGDDIKSMNKVDVINDKRREDGFGKVDYTVSFTMGAALTKDLLRQLSKSKAAAFTFKVTGDTMTIKLGTKEMGHFDTKIILTDGNDNFETEYPIGLDAILRYATADINVKMGPDSPMSLESNNFEALLFPKIGE